MPLQHISDQELLYKTKLLIKEERKFTHQILLHLREIDDRKLYADLKYSSLYDYTMKELGYSEDESFRRISAMRFLKRNPTIAPKVERGEIALSTLNLLDKFQKSDTKSRSIEEVAKSVAGKSKREAEVMLFKDQISAPDKVKECHKVKIKDSTYQKIVKLSAMSGESLDDLLDRLADKELGKHIAKKETKNATDKKSRYIPIAIRTHALKAANHKCQNCGSIYRLEFNHKIPFAKNGPRTKENINLLCRNCNQRQRVVDFGRDKTFALNNI